MKASKIICAAVLTAAAGTSAYFAGPVWKNKICMIAHRGYSSKYLQNTANAFEAAAENGSGGCETDVRITKDGKFVCSHDSVVRFADGTSVEVAEASLAELKQKPLLNRVNGDMCFICSFAEYLEIMKKHRMFCFIEFKGEFPDEKIRELFESAKNNYELQMIQLQSFNFSNLDKAHRMFPELKIMLTYGKDTPGYQENLDAGFDIDADIKTASLKMMKDYHGKGRKVGFWTCNDLLSLRKAQWLHADFIESDVYGGKNL